jgi:hypothetical protein
MSGVDLTITTIEEDEDSLPHDSDIIKRLEFTPGVNKQDVINFDAKKDHMKVYLRVRPLSDDEKNRGEDQVRPFIVYVAKSMLIVFQQINSNLFNVEFFYVLEMY